MELDTNKEGEQKLRVETNTQDPLPELPSITSPMGKLYCIQFLKIGSIFLRKKIETQKEQSSDSVFMGGRYDQQRGDDNFFLFSPPDFSLVGIFSVYTILGWPIPAITLVWLVEFTILFGIQKGRWRILCVYPKYLC